MTEISKRGIRGWPLAFFILNFTAIVVWFILYGGFGPRELQVSSMTPAGEEIDPGRVTEIRLDFNLPLDPESVDSDCLRLVPAVAGRTETAGDRAIRFLPREPLRPATAYTLVLSPALRGKRGEAPPRELLEFSTSRFRLEDAAQVSFDRDSYTVELTFNQPIAAPDLQRALRVTSSHFPDPDYAARQVKVLGGGRERRQRVRIDETRSSYLLITLPAGLAGASGPLGLGKPESLLWKIVGAQEFAAGARPVWAEGLAERELKPDIDILGMTAEWDDGDGYVRIRTTASLDPVRARDYVKVEPEIPVTFASAWNGLKILGDFQPGRQYRVTLAKGMTAGHAGILPRTVSRQVWFDDLPARLSFAHGGGFLSPEGMLKVAVKSRNVESFSLGARRLYAGNIVEALLREYDGDIDADYAEPEIFRKIRTSPIRNQEQETLLDLRDILGGSPLGVYGLEIWRDDSRWSSRNALVAVSDLGLATRLGRNRLLAWTTSIRRGLPRAGVRVAVYSNKRQLLAEGASDGQGVIGLDLPNLPDGEKPALVLAEAENGEFSFVRLDRDMRSRPGEAQHGGEYAAAYESFLSADRGVYRGGEKVLLAGLVKDARVETVSEMPLELRVLGPDMREMRSLAVTADAAGRFEAEIPLGEAYPGGAYQIQVRLPGQREILGSTGFRIADYLPETLSVAMEFDEKPKKDDRDADNRLIIRVARLAGGAMDMLPVTVLIAYRPAPFSPTGWDGWVFGDSRSRGASSERRDRETRLQDDGTALASWDDPDLNFPAAARMAVRAEVSETGGRSSSAGIERILHQVPYYVGVEASRRSVRAGDALVLPLAAVAPDGGVFEAEGGWTGELLRIEYTGVMKMDSSGRLVYEWVRREIPEAKLSGDWRHGRSEAKPAPLAGGGYRLVVSSPGGRSCVYDFTAGGQGGQWFGEDPETLAVALDRDRYRVGDTAVATVSSPFAGRALICIETDRVLAHWLQDFQEGDNRIEIRVDDRMRPNAFVGVTLVRAALAESEWLPHRLSGIGSIHMDNRDRLLQVEMEAPDHLSPGKTASLAIKVSRDGKPAANAPVTLWAVDVGVLSLTGFSVPSPWERFYQKRRAGVREADMFSRLAPELSRWLGAEAAPGGDGGDGELGRRLNPIFASRVKAAVLFDATLRTDGDGVARAEFAIPEFAGRLKFMCWAANGQALGSAEKEVEVKAPVSVAAAWPRFAAPGDSFSVPVTVINRSGEKGLARVRCAVEGGLVVEPGDIEVELADNESRLVHFTAAAGDAGVIRATMTAELGGESFSEKVELPVRPPVLFDREAGSQLLRPGEKKSFILGPGLLAAHSRVKLLIGGSPLINLSGSMEYLLDYPYGCAEQTAARLLALTCLPDLLSLSRPDQLASGDVSRLATACAERLLAMQNSNGSLRTWPGSGGEELFWVSAQALFVLTETRDAGYPLPPGLLENLARYLDDRIESRLNERDLDVDGAEYVSLACLGLARADRLKRAWLMRLEEIAASRAKNSRPFSSAALAYLCEAVAAAGDRESARLLYDRFKPAGPEAGVSRNRVVELAAWLMTATAVGADAAEAEGMAVELADSVKRGYTHWSTRDNSMVLAALGRYWRKNNLPPDAGALLRIDGREEKFSTRKGIAREGLPAGARIEVENADAGSLRVFWLAEGVPLSGATREEDKGLVARRRIFIPGGGELSEPYELKQGQVYEIRLHVTGTADDLVLADLLPAGLEIEDATLKGRSFEGSAAKGLTIRNVERRDDRLLVFASLDQSGEYRYLVRAVTGGGFVWPALDASRMYDASVRSVHGGGKLKVAGGKEAANDTQ